MDVLARLICIENKLWHNPDQNPGNVPELFIGVSDMNEAKKMKWAEYTERIEKLPSVALRFIGNDAQGAIDAMPDGINAGYYADEIHICASELRKRAKKMCNREEQYVRVLSEMFLILKEAGYDSNDMIDDLRDLVNDSQRPAIDEDAGDDDDGRILSTQDLVNDVAASLANWWRTHIGIRTLELLWDAYDALEYLYPDEANE